jgi:ariadne-1
MEKKTTTKKSSSHTAKKASKSTSNKMDVEPNKEKGMQVEKRNNDFDADEYYSRPKEEVCAHLFVPPDEFLNQLLTLVVNEVGPFVPFMDEDASEASKSVQAWKCLNILRALKWNLGKTETILDDQEKCFKLAGILEEPKSFTEKKEVSCSVCCDKVAWKDTSALECQHRFCNDCWKASIENTLSSYSFETLFDHFTCMHKGCNLVILGDLVKKVGINNKSWLHYLNMLSRAFSEANKSTYSICPGCQIVVKTNHASDKNTTVVKCKCAKVFCFKCTLDSHVPASCKDLQQWKAKDTDDEASINLIKATTTECPKCKTPVERVTACNHMSCKCGARFCFVCKKLDSGCSSYACQSYKTVEDYEKSQGNKKDFAPGIKTASEWLVLHERYVAFSKKCLENKTFAEYAENKLKPAMKEKKLLYYELKPGGNPTFMDEGVNILIKSYRIIQYTIVWGFFHIPAKVCAQKQIFEMQIKNYEEKTAQLKQLLEQPAATIDHLTCKNIYQILEKNLIRQIEDAEDLLSLFSEKQIGQTQTQSVLKPWSCPSCNYNNHPETQAKKCGSCQKERPFVPVLWFP